MEPNHEVASCIKIFRLYDPPSTDTWPMMSSPGPVAIVLALYLLFVLRLGPAYMKKRSPYQLKWALVGYNATQVLFSIFLSAKFMLVLIRHGLVHSECLMNEKDTQLEVTENIWWYFAAKVTELLDTVFFVLRKKDSQISFLHIYHHSAMMAGTWFLLKYGPTDDLMFSGFLNSSVHVIMYSYYGLAALGPEYAKYIWWKKYLTRVQLTQFCMIIGQMIVQGYREQCNLPRWITYYILVKTSSFLVLFSIFYAKSYVMKKKYGIEDIKIRNTHKLENKEPFQLNLVSSDVNEEKKLIRKIA